MLTRAGFTAWLEEHWGNAPRQHIHHADPRAAKNALGPFAQEFDRTCQRHSHAPWVIRLVGEVIAEEPQATVVQLFQRVVQMVIHEELTDWIMYEEPYAAWLERADSLDRLILIAVADRPGVSTRIAEAMRPGAFSGDRILRFVTALPERTRHAPGVAPGVYLELTNMLFPVIDYYESAGFHGPADLLRALRATLPGFRDGSDAFWDDARILYDLQIFARWVIDFNIVRLLKWVIDKFGVMSADEAGSLRVRCITEADGDATLLAVEYLAAASLSSGYNLDLRTLTNRLAETLYYEYFDALHAMPDDDNYRRNPRPQRSKTIAVGRCFDWAYRKVFYEWPDAILVHATVEDPWDHHKYKHAWVERDGIAYDWQTSIGLGKGPRTLEDFYALYKPTRIKRYDQIAAARALARAHHFGPWP